jgi:hypothetical protein
MAGRAGCAWRASKRTRLGFSSWISDVSSMRRIWSSSAMNLASAFSRVVFASAFQRECYRTRYSVVA